MKILITGATGFIGTYLFLKLKELKYKVEGLSMGGGIIGGEKIKAVNLTDKKKLHEFMKNRKFDVVVHLAAEIPESFYGVAARQSLINNFLSTLNILDELSVISVKKFIYASSISVIGSTKYFPVDEKHTLEPNNFYSAGKLFGEILSNQFNIPKKRIVTSLRFSSPYGFGQKYGTVIPVFIKYAMDSKNIPIYGTGKRSQDFIYITDVVDAILAAIKRNRSGIYNIGSGQPTTTINLAKIILKNVFNTKSKIVFTGKKDPQEDFRWVININKAKKELKWEPRVSINEGIKNILAIF